MEPSYRTGVHAGCDAIGSADLIWVRVPWHDTVGKVAVEIDEAGCNQLARHVNDFCCEGGIQILRDSGHFTILEGHVSQGV